MRRIRARAVTNVGVFHNRSFHRFRHYHLATSVVGWCWVAEPNLSPALDKSPYSKNKDSLGVAFWFVKKLINPAFRKSIRKQLTDRAKPYLHVSSFEIDFLSHKPRLKQRGNSSPHGHSALTAVPNPVGIRAYVKSVPVASWYFLNTNQCSCVQAILVLQYPNRLSWAIPLGKQIP